MRVQQTLRAQDHKARDLQAAVAPATVGLGLRCNVHRPHAGGSPSARRPASEGGSRYGHTPARAGHAYPTPMGETGGALHGALADALYHRDLLLHRHSHEMGLWSCGVASWGCAFWLVGGGVLRAGIALLAGQERVLSWGTPSQLSALPYLAHALASERLCACGVEPSVVLSVRALVCSVSRVGRHIKHLNGRGGRRAVGRTLAGRARLHGPQPRARQPA